MRSLTYMNTKYMIFCFHQLKWDTDSTFQKHNVENLRNLKSLVNVFVFFVKIWCESKESPLSKQCPPFAPTPF